MHVCSADIVNAASIQSERLALELSLRGLDAAQTADLLRGRRLAEFWLPGLEIVLDNRAATAANGVARPSEHDLADGRVLLRSGHPATIAVEAHHQLENTLLPQSLTLALAQQLARSGLMMVHGAALRIKGNGILVLGARGSGKSVLSAAALSAGAEIVSDDWLLVGRGQNGHFIAERLREFIMLRHGWAADRLLEALQRIGGRVVRGRLKSVLDIGAQIEVVQSRFPQAIDLHQIWLLERPSTGRQADSRLTPCNQADALARIIAATMPLLFGQDFPIEARALFGTVNALVHAHPSASLTTGIDLIETPALVLSRILEQRWPADTPRNL